MSSSILITGAAGGIGRALTEQLAAAGWAVVVAGRDATRLAALPASARVVADVTTPEGASQALLAAGEALGEAPFALAHCVGSTLIASLPRTAAEVYRELLRVNLDSAFYTLQAWVKARGGAGSGSAVFVSSVVARIGVANHEAIAAAKGGLEALVRSAAASHAAQGLRVNAVAPGLTETPMTAKLRALPAQREAAARQYPLAGVQSTAQVAAVMAMLLQAERVTGQVLPVDGGFSSVRPLLR